MLSETLYFTDWYNWPSHDKKLFQFLLQATQQPLFIKIGPQYKLTLETFKSIMNSCYSYFALLLTIMEK